MRKPLRFSILSIGIFVFVPAAHAVHTAFWLQRPISPAAIANDPVLAGMQSWSLMTSYDVGKWSSAGVRATLPAGNFFYQHPQGSNVAPNSTALAMFPGVEFDTYVNDPTGNTTTVLGGHPATPTASFGGSGDLIPGTFSVSWHGPPGGATQLGTFEIARLTFPLGVVPNVLQGPPSDSQSASFTVNPLQEAFVGQIPEPATIGLVALGAAPLARRQGRQ